MLGAKLRLWAIAGAVAGGLCVAFLGGRSFLYYVCQHYPYANSVFVDFDYAGGRVRVRAYFLWMKLRETIGETEQTALYRKLIGEPPPPVWGGAYSIPYVDRFGGIYGDGVYGGALARARDGWWSLVQGGLRPDAAKPALLQYLALLADPDEGEADPDRWCEKLRMVILLRKERGMPPLGVEDLSGLDEQYESLILQRKNRVEGNKPPSG